MAAAAKKKRRAYQEHDERMTCPECRSGVIVHTEGGFPTCNEGSVFICTECDWISPDGYEHDPTTPTEHHVVADVVKKQKSKKQTKEFLAVFHAEKQRQMNRLTKERAKFPPSLIKKGKKWISNPKFTDKMRDHMHTFAVDEDAIAEQIVLSGIPRFVVVKKKHTS